MGTRPADMLAVKRLAGVAPEVILRNQLHGDKIQAYVPGSLKQGYQWLHKRACDLQGGGAKGRQRGQKGGPKGCKMGQKGEKGGVKGGKRGQKGANEPAGETFTT